MLTIKPNRDWQNEIEKALNSMDCLIALLTPTFHESYWTDQEIGFALGRNVPIISVRIGKDPYGFIGKLQGFQAKGKRANEITEEIVKLLGELDLLEKIA
jgi:TIR domain